MKRFLALLCLISLAATAQEEAGTAYPAELAVLKSKDKTVLTPTSSGVLPHVAIGGPWKTFIIIMNLEELKSNRAPLRFYRSDGSPMPVALSGNLAQAAPGQAASAWDVETAPNGTLFLEVIPAVNPESVQTGWVDVYSEAGKRMMVSGIFRAVLPGRPDMEAVVPLEWAVMNKTLVSFDNTRGFTTSMALVNPYDDRSLELLIEIISANGVLLGTYRELLAPKQHIAFETNTRWPASAGNKGSIRIKGVTSTTYFSGLAILFNPSGSITTAPLYQDI